MDRLIVILTGPICSGKTTLSNRLAMTFGFHEFRTKDWIAKRGGKNPKQERRSMQRLGELLDIQTKGTWTSIDLTKFLVDLEPNAMVIVDAPRSALQIKAIRSAFTCKVFHVHLEAPLRALESRYKIRERSGFKELSTYSQARRNQSEARVGDLAMIADLVINTDLLSEDEVLVRVASQLGLYDRQ